MVLVVDFMSILVVTIHVKHIVVLKAVYIDFSNVFPKMWALIHPYNLGHTNSQKLTHSNSSLSNQIELISFLMHLPDVAHFFDCGI